MAVQRVSLAKIGGRTAQVVTRQFQRWEQTQVDGEFPTEVQFALDDFAEKVRANSAGPPIVYFTEWIDMWSMGDLIPDLGDEHATTIIGRRYQACCHRPPLPFKTTTIDGKPPQESHWLKRRLEEATDAWDVLVPDRTRPKNIRNSTPPQRSFSHGQVFNKTESVCAGDAHACKENRPSFTPSPRSSFPKLERGPISQILY